MNIFLQTNSSFLDNFGPLRENIVPALLMVLKVIGFIILAWFILKIVTKVIGKILKVSKVDVLSTKLNDANIFGNPNIKINFGAIILKTIRWVIILILGIAASEQLGLTMISELIKDLINYLPKLLTALVMLLVGLYVASLIKKGIQGFLKSMDVSGGNLLGNIAFMVIAIMVSITALNQAGVNTEIITSNLTLIFGSLLLSVSIAFGLGSRDIIQRLLFGFYSRKNVEIGRKIKIKDIEGVVVSIDNICMILETETGRVILPIKDVVDQKIEVI